MTTQETVEVVLDMDARCAWYARPVEEDDRDLFESYIIPRSLWLEYHAAFLKTDRLYAQIWTYPRARDRRDDDSSMLGALGQLSRRTMTQYTFAVITSVSQPPDAGNMKGDLEVYLVEDRGAGLEEVVLLREVMPEMTLAVRTPVFQMGEILILNESGREVGYPGRKPSKWAVEYDEFPVDQLEAAVARAKDVMYTP